MRSRRLSKMAALVLVLAVASGIGAITAAQAACSTKVYFAQGGVQKTSVAPDASGDVVLKCLHDAFGNPTPNQQIDFFVTPPGGTETSIGNDTTDANGDASVAFGGPGTTTVYGDYAFRGVYSQIVSVSGVVTVAAGAPSGTFAITKTELNPSVGNPLNLQATGIKDVNLNAVANGTKVKFTVLGPSGFAKAYNTTTTGVAQATDTASAALTVPGADLTRAGSYTVKAVAENATACNPACSTATGTDLGPFNIAPGAVAQISAAVTPAAVIAGTNYTVKAQNGLDQFGNKASGSPVVFEITDALNNVTTIPADPINDPPILLDSNGSTTATASAAAVDVAYGTYTLVIKSGTTAASPPVTYTVFPGAVTGITTAAPSEASVLAGSQVTIIVNGVNSGGYAAKTGTVVRLEAVNTNPGTRPGPQQKIITGVTKGNDPAGASFDLSGEFQTVTGSYQYKVIVESVTTLVNFTVTPGSPVAELTVTANDVRQYSNGVVNISGAPAITTSFRVHVTRPNGTTFDVAGAPGGSPATVTLAAADISSLGTYGVQVYAKDVSNTVIGVGSTSFTVATAIPDAINVEAASAVILPLGTQTITATATLGGLPTPGRNLQYIVKNTIGQTVISGSKIADQNGKITFTISGAQTLMPGPYTATVSDSGGASGTVSFTV